MKKPPFKHLAHQPSFVDEPVVYFTLVTYRRRPLLARDDVHMLLRDVWNQSGERSGWWVGDYILMPDHAHFFARCGRTSIRMSDWMRTWKSYSSRRIAALTGQKAPIWQEEYFDRYLRSSEDYSEKWSYIERNALEANLVSRPEDWPYRGRIHALRW